MDIKGVQNLEDIESSVNGHYWTFPEFIWAYGNSLKGAKLVEVTTSNAKLYLRARQNSAALINWQGEYTQEAVKEVWNELRELGLDLITFNPTEKDLPIPSYTTNLWKTYKSLIESNSGQKKWRLKRSLSLLDFSPMQEEDLPEALECLHIWHYESERRHGNVNIAAHLQGLPYDKNHKEFAWVMGQGLYVYATKNHFNIPNSRFFVGRNKEDGHVVGVVGGWVNGDNASCMILKHDFSAHENIRSLWTKWTEYIHTELGCKESDNGTTSDLIKTDLGMTKVKVHKPIKYRLSLTEI